jgi:hypothetical protein
LGTVLPNNQLKCKKWLGGSKNIISKLGSFKLLGWLHTFYYGGIQAQSKCKSLGWLDNSISILWFVGKQIKNFQVAQAASNLM